MELRGNTEDFEQTRAFADRPGGSFVDVGAGEPVSGSLTKNLVDPQGRVRGPRVDTASPTESRWFWR
ncbi:hypothetical protein E1287_00930 [Actinomadura sp. KC06]|uniref:hypothetical protein n=1 Tax=Actinomadura sp. KC06 TaxID=2530369 RepID=UPI00104E10FA|nr:hypothetical protein [Actinomadura sp. KC06]TDD40567.1 hypothetical protein E1287_00930 [Actinomadura sp. KC06]